MAGEIGGRLVVSDEQFQYLRLQKGSLWHLCHDREHWLAAYEQDLSRTYLEIQQHLPVTCWGLLDIGSGLGGVDVLLSRHYGGDPPFVHLLDGEHDAAEMHLHRETFNDMRVAREFLITNGVRADRFAYFTTAAENLPRPYDLVISLGSWCFHYPPEVYLPLLLSGGGLHRDSVLIIDVRNRRPEYERALDRVLERTAVIRCEKKFTRAVYRRAQ
jgi:SAM-dependent methyltransferase